METLLATLIVFFTKNTLIIFIIAFAAGIFARTMVNKGQLQKAKILATVASYRRIKIALDVSASQASAIAKGQEVQIPLEDNPTDGGDGRYLQGSVASVSLSADPDSRLFRVDLEVDNPDGELKPGSLVAPRIKIASSGGGPAVPESALMKVNGDESVYVITGSGEDRRAELRESGADPGGRSEPAG